TDGVLNGNTEQESNITITLDQSSALLEPDGRITLTATVTPAANVTWETDKTGIIVQDSTNSDGNTITYRGLKAGEVNVRACVGERQSEPCKITVSGVAFVTSTVTVPVGGSVDMTVTTYGKSKNVPVSSWEWVSADSNIAIVTPTSSGSTVRGVQPGQTTLNVTIGEYKATCLVNVADTAITTIGLSESTITMAPGTSSRLRANTTADSGDIQWTVSNSEIVTIAERSGYTVVLASGSIGVTTVTAQLGSGASASCTVIVDSRQSEPTPSPSPDEGKEAHTVTFDENGGGGFMNAVTVSGGTYTLPENGFSAPYGMRFQAWGVGDMEYPPNVTIAISGDLTVMALWEPDPTPLAQGYCGANGTNLSWTLSRDWHLTVSGTGDMQSYDDSTRAPWYGYHTNISSATLESGVTSIGSAAFTYCAALEEVTLPDTLVSIGDNAFFNCAALEEVEFPGGLAALGNSAFYGCEALTGIELPPRIADIGNYTFAHCTELETASLPAGLTRVGLYAFYDCGSLRSVAVPSGVTTLDIGAFKDCGALRTVSFPAGLTAINASVFEGCGSLYNQSYAGTVSQFEQIAMTLGAGNDELKEHVVHCSDGDYDWTPPDPYRILDNLQDMDEFQDQIWHLAGPLSEFERFTIDERQLQRSSELLRNGSDYVASEGSTKLTIPAESFRTFGEGSHTAAAEFDNAATGTETRKQMYTVFPKPGTAKISLREMLGVTGVEKVSYSGRFQSDPVLGDGLYRFVLISGEIPPGLTLEEGGYFTGVARTAGSYHFEVGLQVKRGNDWPSGYEDTAQMDITIEPGTREQIKVVSDPGYEIVKPVSDQITESTETVIEPENFTLISNGPYEEFKDLYIDAELKIRDVDYEVMPYNNGAPTLLDGGAATQTYIVGKNLSVSAGTHTLSLEFEHKDNLDNKKIHKAAQTFSVKKRGSGGDNDYSSGGISGGGGGGGGSATPHYTITKKKAANGAITLSKSNAASGTTVTITPKPNKGYQVDKVSVTASNKKDVPVSVSKGVYSFKMPSRRVTVSATFKPVSATTPASSTASVAPTEHGAVKLSSASPLPGVSVTVHTTPEPGYQVMGVTVSAPGKGGIK
ncbi:MAG: leucine-rich repeat protein, partial [Oscillibacter sp.]|nr:leucine-rich repeat protein [Oscillibacter sp.]